MYPFVYTARFRISKKETEEGRDIIWMECAERRSTFENDAKVQKHQSAEPSSVELSCK